MTQESRLLTTELLEALRNQWVSQGMPVATRLRPGLTSAEIDELTSPIGVILPGDAKAWWMWHDGAEASQRIEKEIAGPGFMYLSLAEALAQYEVMRNAAPADDRDLWWNPQWFPVTVSVYGRAIAVDAAVAPDAPTPIHSVSFPDETPEQFGAPRLSSFSELVAVWIDAFERGTWRYDGHDSWIFDQSQHPPERAIDGLT